MPEIPIRHKYFLSQLEGAINLNAFGRGDD